MNINPVDIGIIVIIALALLRGLWNGFLVEVGGIAGLVAGLLLAGRFYGNLAQLLNRAPWNANWNVEIAFIILFLVGVLVIHLIVRLLRPLTKQPVLGGINSLAGLVLGALKGAILCSVAVTVLLWLVPNWELLRESRLLEYLVPLFNWLTSLLHW